MYIYLAKYIYVYWRKNNDYTKHKANSEFHLIETVNELV